MERELNEIERRRGKAKETYFDSRKIGCSGLEDERTERYPWQRESLESEKWKSEADFQNELFIGAKCGSKWH